MSDTTELSEAKRLLLERYLRGELQFATTTANATTQRVEAEEADPRAGVVEIQVGGLKRPFFFLHGDWVSGAYWCIPLARGLGPEQPFYALEPYRFECLPPSLESIASAHLKVMRTVQPEGPYLLGGFCNGGLLAYEMARQLHREGQKLDLLVLMDPMGLVYPARYRIATALIRWLGKLLRLAEEKQLYAYILLQHLVSYLKSSHYRQSRESWQWNIGKRSEPSERSREPGFVWSRFQPLIPPIEAVHRDYPNIYDWSAVLYKPADLYPGKITFFWDGEEPFRRVGWRKVHATNEVELHIIPGTQMASRTEYLPILTEHLRTCLNNV